MNRISMKEAGRYAVKYGAPLAAMTLACAVGFSAQARDIGGFEVDGYTRFGAYSSPAGTPRSAFPTGQLPRPAGLARMGQPEGLAIDFRRGRVSWSPRPRT